jgi:PiT family inorganic phosphate transporter
MNGTALGLVPSGWTYLFLILAILLALTFEFVNGFHDTANAAATVIYTNTLRPKTAVVWSGFWNWIGVLTSSGMVAYGIVALLPVDLVLHIGSGLGFAMVFSLLLSAILWNVGTWFFGLPASSSHTLIGAILGVGLANSFMGPSHAALSGVNWAKAQEVALGLLISPAVGFCAAAGLLLLARALLKEPTLYRAPEGKRPPPWWIRTLLLTTCTGVSFAHGSNDGQKGMGLIVLILVGLLPGTYALNLSAEPHTIHEVASATEKLAASLAPTGIGTELSDEQATAVLTQLINRETPHQTLAALRTKSQQVARKLHGLDSLDAIQDTERAQLRRDLYLLSISLKQIEHRALLTDSQAMQHVATLRRHIQQLTNYIPGWVKFAVALALGLGTMIGYRRIVVTVGERIGKEHLSYAQGGAAELVAMVTILLADHFGLPVSTTHVLSSGIAGTMAANRSGLQIRTLRNILLAWALTLPVCIFLGALLFAFGMNMVALLRIE